MSSTAVLAIEQRLGGSLPAAYRAFLQTHESSHLLPNWLVRTAEPVPGGYLYLSVGQDRPGAFFARFPFQDPRFYLVAIDFDDLRARSRLDPER
jgi:hypothetical protein